MYIMIMMSRKHIIALCGYKGCGKDYVAKYIQDTYNFEHMKISSKLKEISKVLFDLTDGQIENTKEQVDKTWGVTPRQMMQFMGTEMFQYKIQELLPGCERDFWIKSFVNSVKKTKTENIVISDMRFLHEYMYLRKHLKEYNVTVIRIENVANNVYDRGDEHASEIEYTHIPVDFQITNNMTPSIRTLTDSIINVITY